MAKRLWGIMLILLFVAGSVWAGSDEEALKARSQGWIKAFNAGDAKTLALVYTPDGKLLPPNSEVVEGRKLIEAYWAPFVEGVKGELDIQEAHTQGDIGYLLGTYKITDEGGNLVDRGKYLEIWKRSNGQWGLHRDIWNTSLPQAESIPN